MAEACSARSERMLDKLQSGRVTTLGTCTLICPQANTALSGPPVNRLCGWLQPRSHNVMILGDPFSQNSE